ncbi:MAG: tetratricopeptide repeat protein [Bacteroidota bacterium]
MLNVRLSVLLIFLCLEGGVRAQNLDSVRMVRTVDSLIQISRALTGKQSFEEALEINEKAKISAETNFGRDNAQFATCIFNKGRIYFYWGKNQEAEKCYIESVEIRKKVLGTENLDYAQSVFNLGYLYMNTQRYKESEALLLEALRIRREILGELTDIICKTTNAIGVLYYYMGNFEKSEIYYIKEGLLINAIYGKNTTEHATNLMNLGILYNDYDESGKAEKVLLEAKKIIDEGFDKQNPLYATILNTLGICYKSKGQYDKVEPLYKESIRLRAQALGKMHPDYAQSLNNLAEYHRELGQFKEAEPLYMEAGNVIKATLGTDHPYYAINLSNKGILYCQMGQFEIGGKLLKDGLELNGKLFGLDHPEYIKGLTSMANYYMAIGDPKSQENTYLKAMELNNSRAAKVDYLDALIKNNLANYYESIGFHDKSDSFYLDALLIRENLYGRKHPDFLYTLKKFAEHRIKMNQFGEYEHLYIEACVGRQMDMKQSSTFLTQKEENVYLNQFNYDLSSSLSILYRKNTALVQLKEYVYDQALFYKGFVLSNVSRLHRMAQTDTTAANLYQQLASCQRRLNREYTKSIEERDSLNLTVLEGKANALEKELIQAVPGYSEALKMVNWKDVQSALHPNEAAIEFIDFQLTFPNENSDSILYAALLIRPGDLHPLYIPLCEARQLGNFIETQGNISKNNLYAFQGTEKPSLYELLWKPLAPLLKETKTIYFSPSGLLHRLNLSAIMEPTNTVLGSHFKLNQLLSTRQLVEKELPQSVGGQQEAAVFGGINYDADSSSIASVNRSLGMEQKEATRGYLAYADSSFFTGAWKYLPGTEKEATNITEILQSAGFQVHLYTGNAATEEAVKQMGQGQKSPFILHAATHGYFFPDPAYNNKQTTSFGGEPIFKISEHPLIRSGLILAGANKARKSGRPAYEGAEDGILTAHEVSQMNLSNTALVVLSACETGLGDIKGNEGVYGLQRAFYIAGAKYILMSLWKVSDNASSELMSLFYRYWLQDKMDLEDAFRRAQQELRVKYEDPEYWAGFVLVKG